MENNKTIKEMAYDLYKQNWIDTNTTREMRLDCLREYYSYIIECNELDIEIDSFDDWLFNNGYNGSLYVCYDEFLVHEYQDKDFISTLFSDDTLVEMYLKDME